MVVQEPVKTAIWNALNTYCFTDAMFMAERLYAEVGSEECLHLLATCYYRAGNIKRTYNLLRTKTVTTIHNKYLLAISCFSLKKYAEAENALVGYSCSMNTNTSNLILNEYGSLAGVTLQLLGNIYRKTDVQSKAKECFRQSLKVNPFLWSSFEALCQLGEKIDILDYFKTTSTVKAPQQMFPSSYNSEMDFLSPDNFQHRYSTNMRENLDPSKAFPFLTSTAVIRPPEAVSGALDVDNPVPTNRAISRLRQRIVESQTSGSPITPSFGVLPVNTPVMETPNSPFITPTVTLNKNQKQVKAPVKLQVKKNFAKSSEAQPSFGVSTMSSDSPASDTENQLVPGLRRSSRLYSGNSSNRESKRTPKVRFNDMSKPMGNTCRKTKSRIIKASSTQPLTPTTQNIIQASTKICKLVNEPEDLLVKDEKPCLLSPIQQSTDGLMRLFQDIGKAYQCLLLYDCKKAVSLLEELPYHQLSTSWVMEKLAIAYFELGDFELACKAFEKVREYDPYYIEEGMALYSSLLWLQRKETMLASLAKDLVTLDRDSAISWCAMGNCFSSQKEHDLAIKFFERAVQVDPGFAYSYTLLGHEYVATEEFERALTCYRTALQQNTRHYNAWYGLGMVYYKQEKYVLAQQHYERALKINPTNSSLMCNLAVTQNELKKYAEALNTITRAAEMNPTNALCRYHKASILLDAGKAENALEELLELKNLEPKESNIYYQIGKCYQSLGKIHLAQMNFSWALSLEPNGTNSTIKEAMNQQRYQNDDSEMIGEDDITDDLTTSQQINVSSQPNSTVEEDGVMAIDSTVGTSFQ